MFELAELINTPPYSLDKSEKSAVFVEALRSLTMHHRRHCAQYARILDALGFDEDEAKHPFDFPFLPVRLFKEYDLLSVDKSEVIKTMTSSGTTGQRVSKIFLDRQTSTDQTKVLTKIVSSFTGPKRLPMLIADTSSVIKDRNLFSARGAGILGFSMLGYDVTYALDAEMRFDEERVGTFLEKHQGESVLIFGFTFMVWEHFYKVLKAMGRRLPLENGILMHGGGWKKLIEQAVDNDTFKARIQEVSGISRVCNYYGMVEQTGSIFMECEKGHLHASIFSDVIIRDHHRFSALGPGEPGLVQLVSLLPRSYPGHSLLSEDRGELLGEDDCPCGRKGKYFKIHGRIKSAEIRGCGDTYAAAR